MERLITALFIMIIALALVQPPPQKDIISEDETSSEMIQNYDTNISSNLTLENDTIKIASFNIKIFGQTKSSKENIMETLVEIVKRYDVIAIQEIKDISEETPHLFLEKINQNNSNYGMILSERTGLHENDKSSQEQYAVYYNKEKITAKDSGILFNDSVEDLFQREPLTTQLSTIDGDMTFVIQIIHTKPSAALEEIEALHDVFEWSKLQYPNEDDFIMLGDFNAGCSYASPEELDGMEIRSQNYTWVIPDNADTNLANSTCAYDRIVISENTNPHFTGNWGVDNTFTNNSISDHWPIWFEIYV